MDGRLRTVSLFFDKTACLCVLLIFQWVLAILRKTLQGILEGFFEETAGQSKGIAGQQDKDSEDISPLRRDTSLSSRKS